MESFPEDNKDSHFNKNSTFSLFLNKIVSPLFRKAETGVRVPGATGSERSNAFFEVPPQGDRSRAERQAELGCLPNKLSELVRERRANRSLAPAHHPHHARCRNICRRHAHADTKCPHGGRQTLQQMDPEGPSTSLPHLCSAGSEPVHEAVPGQSSVDTQRPARR